MPAMSTQLFHLHIIEEWKKQIDTAALVPPAGRVRKIQKVQAPSVAGTWPHFFRCGKESAITDVRWNL